MSNFNIRITNIKWENFKAKTKGQDPTIIEFDVYKKGIFGKLKKVPGEYCLMFDFEKENNININSICLHEMSSGILPLNPHLTYGVMQSAAESMENAGEDEKADIIRKTSKLFFKSKILQENS